jgi:hypothetical protein
VKLGYKFNVKAMTMQMHAFYLFLRYAGVDAEEARIAQSEPLSGQDWIERAMQHMNSIEKDEIVQFINRSLLKDRDKESLARIFDDGNSYRIWHSADGPRQLLLAIRQAALSDGSKSSTAQSGHR